MRHQSPERSGMCARSPALGVEPGLASQSTLPRKASLLKLVQA